MLADTAYQVIHDEVMLDGNSRLNLATFVGTWMEPYAQRLYADTVDKNLIDKDEYPATAAIEERCWRILADLWHAPSVKDALGTSTVGSSEASMLAGLAMKRRWQAARRAAGKPIDRPNLVMSSAVQVCWEKFANYFDVEPRYVPITDEHPVFDGHELERYVDENTIGVVAIMGVTYTGAYEPVAQIAGALDRIQLASGIDVPIHVDAASGGFVAPFLQPDLAWDFRVPRVVSINASGHKYGLVFPGVGWVVWREVDAVPKDMIFTVAYLGGEMPTWPSTSPAPAPKCCCSTTTSCASASTASPKFSKPARTSPTTSPARSPRCPPSNFSATAATSPSSPGASAPATPTNGTCTTCPTSCANAAGWCRPTHCPTTSPDRTVQRIVVRDGLSMDLAERLLGAIRDSVHYLDGLSAPMPKEGRQHGAFHH